MSFGVALILAASAAQPYDVSAEFDLCVDQARADPEFATCYASEIERADARLNERWRQLMEVVDTLREDERNEIKQSLVGEQRAWIEFKDQACDFYWEGYLGTMSRVIFGPSCKLQIYNARIDQLEAIIGTLDPEYYEGRRSF